MKSLFYKFSHNIVLKLFIMLYFWLLIPLLIGFNNVDIFTTPAVFLGASAIFLFEQNDAQKSKYFNYMSYLPVSRKSYASFLFLITLISELVMLIIMMFFVFESPAIFHQSIMSSTPLINLFLPLISSMLVTMAMAGFSIYLSFRFSYTVSAGIYLFYSFILGFVCGYFGHYPIETVSGNVIASVVSVVLCLIEWRLSVMAFENKDM